MFHMRVVIVVAALASLLPAPSPTRGAEEPAAVKHQITGLFSVDREDDLREAVAAIPHVRLVSIDFKNAEASFIYDAGKAFPGAKPEQIVDRLDQLLKNASHHTFGVKALRTTPADRLAQVDIPVIGLDCKGCAWAAYQSVYRIEGVEMATVSFKEGRVTALIEKGRTNREALETALRNKGVRIKEPEKEKQPK